jgi:hypothetical protein
MRPDVRSAVHDNHATRLNRMFLDALIAESSVQAEEDDHVRYHHQDFEAGCP